MTVAPVPLIRPTRPRATRPGRDSMTLIQSKTSTAIQTLDVLAGHPRVALKLIELSRDPDAEVSDYSKAISSDPSLTGRMISIVNSAWYSPATPIATVEGAVCMLGLGQVRVIALSHCLASLHQSMSLPAEDARVLWCGSMLKAIAARKAAECTSSGLIEESYVSGLLQDLGLCLFQSIDSRTLTQIHGGRDLELEAILKVEHRHFGLDHQACGELIGRRMDLPARVMDAICDHHGSSTRTSLPVRIASTLPHDGKTWCPRQFELLTELLGELEGPPQSVASFIQEVEAEFNEFDEQLGNQSCERESLLDALVFASQENARSASTMVSQNVWLQQGKSSLNEKLTQAERAHVEAQQRAERDPLTKLFNRDGWDRRARKSLRDSDETNSVGVAFFDLDHFKQLNDEYGHVVGDRFLVEVSNRLQESVRAGDIVCRWGGDEFVVLFSGGTSHDCLEAVHRVQAHMCGAPFLIQDLELPVSVTVGFVSLEAESKTTNLGDLLQMADEQLYKAKELERGTLSSTRFSLE